MGNERRFASIIRFFEGFCVFLVVFQVVDCFVGVRISPSTVFTKSTTVKLLVTLSNTTAARVKGTEVKCSIREVTSSNLHNRSAENRPETNFNRSESGISETESEFPSPTLTVTPVSTSISGNSTRSITWYPEEKTILFTETITLPLTLFRKEHQPSKVLERFRVECVVVGGHPKAGARTEVIADVRPFLKIDWDSARARGATIEELRYEKPAYEEIAPCPCDVSESSCDVDCCCDSDCNSKSLEGFNCVTVNTVASARDLRGCFLRVNSREYWFPLVCVHATNSPYLGHYYPEAPVVKSYTPISNSNSIYLPKSSRSGKYHRGVRLRSGETVPGVAFAARILDDKCTFAAPVGFLKDTVTMCPLRTSSTHCVKGSTLDAGRYVKSLRSGEWNFSAICKRDGSHETGCDEAGIRWNNDTKVCDNVVNTVNVVFLWHEGLVDKVIATIVVENEVREGSRHLAEFAVRFEHGNRVVDDDRSRPLVPGNQWFTLGSPVILGTQDRGNGTNFSTGSKPAADLKVLRMLRQDGDGVCSKKLGHPVQFGVDSFSGCYLHLSHEDEESCHILRRKTLAHACSLLPPSSGTTSIMMTKVMMMMMTSREGNPNMTSWPDFIPLLRLDACTNLTIEDHSRANGPSPSSCPNVTTHLEVTVIYKPLHASSSNQISGTRLNPFHVLGATIRTSNSYWRRNNGSMGVGKILLTSSLMFVQVGENGSTKSFWLRHDSRPCSQDCCWAEMLEPAERTASATVQMVLLSSLMALSAFYLAQGIN